MTATLAVFCGILGLLIGSFLNVVIWRVPRGESVVRPPSHCPHCDHRLAPLDNIPLLSWLALRGRCRYCGGPISARYPAVELTTGVLFAGLDLLRRAASLFDRADATHQLLQLRRLQRPLLIRARQRS